MDLRDYLTVLRSRWIMIAVFGLGAVALAAAFTWSATPQYASSARLFISTSGATDDSQALQGSQFSLQRVKSYADLLTGQQIAQRVVDELDLDESPKDLAKQISASSKLDTVILTVTVTDPSPERAKVLAGAVSDQFVGYVAELETPPGKDEATIKATVVDPASEPSAPISPRPKRNLALGLLLGLVLGAGMAVVRDTLDTTVKSMKVLEDLVKAPILGAIAYDADAERSPLINDLGSYAPRVEGFRVLRTNLQFIDPDLDRKVFVVTSSLPAEGKTTTATNLALVLAEGGERVALVEADLRRPKISSYLNIESAVGLTTVLVGRVDLDEAMQHTAIHPNLEILTSGRTPPNPAELLKSHAMTSIIKQLRENYDIVLIDAPPLLPVTDAALLAAQSDGAILVVRHGKTTNDQLRAAGERMRAVGAKPVGVIFNMTPTKGPGQYGYGYGYGYGYAPDDAGHAEPSRSWFGRRSSRRATPDQTS
ncbi:polysaccharide biosynthesis tyrosine autokinase [Aeromicrobium sp. 9AM]|uniref:polysaccharide biosynthesis tyrosine autokinase n=1 Tax=Aeromicrobium sp. 9AM TaxID=2653126 RepID=UPI0012EF1D3F|nr:polysaccharide biosynthesis tyrosine autokinase [Aeromicrobium sp. 9AM]VXB52495.1 Capsular biosynthesis protein [Aeromicrobium sp. 9AM]